MNKTPSKNRRGKLPLPPNKWKISLLKQIGEWLKSRRIYHDFPIRAPCRICRTKLPVGLAIYRGQIIFIEVKKRGEKPAPEKTENFFELMDAGAMIVIADSFDDFTEQFSAIREQITSQNMELIR